MHVKQSHGRCISLHQVFVCLSEQTKHAIVVERNKTRTWFVFPLRSQREIKWNCTSPTKRNSCMFFLRSAHEVDCSSHLKTKCSKQMSLLGKTQSGTCLFQNTVRQRNTSRTVRSPNAILPLRKQKSFVAFSLTGRNVRQGSPLNKRKLASSALNFSQNVKCMKFSTRIETLYENTKVNYVSTRRKKMHGTVTQEKFESTPLSLWGKAEVNIGTDMSRLMRSRIIKATSSREELETEVYHCDTSHRNVKRQRHGLLTFLSRETSYQTW